MAKTRTARGEKLVKSAPRSARALERAALQERYSGATAYRLRVLTEAKPELISDIRKYYTDARAKAVKAIARIEKSDVGFVDAPPVFAKTSELSDSELLLAVGDINKFLRGQSYGSIRIKERRVQREKAIGTLRNRGISVTSDNYNSWVRFQRWFANSMYSKMADSDGEMALTVFEMANDLGKSNARIWNKLFKEVLETGI